MEDQAVVQVIIQQAIESLFLNQYPPKKIYEMIMSDQSIINELVNMGKEKPRMMKNIVIAVNNFASYLTPETIINYLSTKEEYLSYAKLASHPKGKTWLRKQIEVLKMYTRAFCKKNDIEIKC